MKWTIMFMLLLCGASNARDICITSGNYEPYVNDSIHEFGPLSVVVKEAFLLEGITVNYDFNPWVRSYKKSLVGDCEGTIMWTKNDERAESFYFSKPIYIGYSVLFFNKSKPVDWDGKIGLEGSVVGGTLGYSYSKLEELERKGKIKIIYSENDYKTFEKLLKNRVDFVQLDKNVGDFVLSKNFEHDEINKIGFHEIPIKTDSYSLLLTKSLKDNDKLLKKFNLGLKKLKESGRYEEILVEYDLYLP